ncbi:hypothetical protein SELMODRAFT_410145 [Selaginella moellendorffii]|uniref:Uncharacterized protein n=1 Tax=Selaginella moellendorffii TaxID=88036 RepID=D8RDS5_SELML|nr:hypothetical protein SELMODRAFT_410145 [Selaginella moellendorffii]
MALMQQLSSPRYSGNVDWSSSGGALPSAALPGSCCRLPPAFYGSVIRAARAAPPRGATRIMASAAEAAEAKPRRAAKDVKITWGVHNGKTLGMLSDDYLNWLVNTVKAEWGRLAQEVIDERKANPSYTPRPPPPPRQAPSETSTTSGGGFSFGFKRYAKENIDYIRSVDIEAGRDYPECCDEPEFPSKDDFTRYIKNAGDNKDFKEAQRVHARVYNSNTEEADRLRAQSGLPDSDKGGRVPRDGVEEDFA